MTPLLSRLWARVLDMRPKTNRTLIVETTKMALLLHVFLEHVYTIKGTKGASMLPTMAQFGDGVLVDQQCRRGRHVEVGDIVDVKHLFVMGDGAIKRVLGMPGDFVLRDTPGKGQGMMIQVGAHAASSIGTLANGVLATVQVPEGHCWLAGDNQSASRDSRLFGPFPLAMIKGRVTTRLFPFSSIGRLGNTLKDAGDID